MQLTTSKHASKELQALARRLAAHIPQCRYLPRSERALERLQTLAARAGEDTLLVLASPQTDRPLPAQKSGAKATRSKKKSVSPPIAVLSSRQRDADGAWAWQDGTLSLIKIKFGQPMALLTSPDDPLEIRISAAKPSRPIAAFLGLAAGKTQPLFEQSTPVSLSATAQSAELKLEKKSLLKFEYVRC